MKKPNAKPRAKGTFCVNINGIRMQFEGGPNPRLAEYYLKDAKKSPSPAKSARASRTKKP